MKRSWQTFKDKKENELRWFVAPDRASYNKLLTTYVSAYLTHRGPLGRKRLIKHLGEINFDMTIIVDASLKNFNMDFLNLEHLGD